MRSVKRIIALFFVLVSFLTTANGQNLKDFNWIDFQQEKHIVLQGQLRNEQFKNRFDRLPASHENKVRKEVWELSKNPAGVYLDFFTLADTMMLSYTYELKNLKHMTPLGISGVDLYAQTKKGEWLLVKGIYKSFNKDETNVLFEGLKANEVTRYRLYFPLYSNIANFKMGLNKQSKLVQLPPYNSKPIIVYGTSIAQGASASRAGMAWAAVLGRKIKEPIINLGFSANGRLEKELVDLITDQDASLYIIDCLPNLVHLTDEEVYQRLLYTLNTIRKQHSKTPIVFTEHADATITLLNNSSQLEYQRVNKNLRKFIADHIKGKDEHVYVLTAEAIGLGVDDTTDSIHPSDLGMMKYADAYEKLISVFLR